MWMGKRLIHILLVVFLLSLQPSQAAAPLSVSINPRYFVTRQTEADISTVIERNPSNWELYIEVDGGSYARSTTIQLHDTAYLTQNILHLRNVPCDVYSVVVILTRKVDGAFKEFRAQTTMECFSEQS
jgi:hypothetical protein